MAQQVKLIPLGGVGEIGLNMVLIEGQEAAFVVDAGLMFPEDHMLGVDLVIPDVTYLRRIKEKLKAFIFTHGHEDHIGAYPFIWEEFNEVPVFGTGFTLGILEQRLKDQKGEGLKEFFLIKPGDRIQIDEFQIEFFRVCHSIPDCVGLKVDTPQGVLLHMSDFKLEFSAPPYERTDLRRLSQYAKEGVLLLLLDATNADKGGSSLSEDEVTDCLEDLIRGAKGRVIVALFSSNIRRIGHLLSIAEKTNRRVAFVGKSLVDNVSLAKEMGYLELPKDLVRMEEVDKFPPEELLIVTTGSQAEPMSALSLMAIGAHKYLKVRPGDLIILSSRFITGKERSITHMINNLSKQGAEVIYPEIAPVHASGHAQQEELELIIRLTRPQYLVPFHGEWRQLVYCKRLAQKIGMLEERVVLAEDGDVVCLEDGMVRISKEKRVEAGKVFVDGKGIGDVHDVVLRDRRHLSEDGIVVSVMVLKEETGEIVSGPDIITKGVFLEEKGVEVLKRAKEMLVERCQKASFGFEGTDLEEEVRRALRNFFRKNIGRSPVVIPVVIRM